MNNKEKTLVEKHALHRLKQVEKNKQKAYEKKTYHFPWKTFLMGICFAVILSLFIIQIFFR